MRKAALITAYVCAIFLLAAPGCTEIRALRISLPRKASQTAAAASNERNSVSKPTAENNAFAY